MSKTYAVVDLETTAPAKNNGRIIQIGIVLIKNEKVVDHFSSLVNPEQVIPETIISLTRITNKQVATAPKFADLAPTIIDFLQDTIFIAHNIVFDFNFLNLELAQANFPQLNNPTYDTVELTQIFFPELTSFKLEDLSTELSLSHDQPHQALSDAYTTALLFLKIKAKLATIPDVTLKKINSIADNFLADNKTLIEQELASRRNKKVPINNNQLVVNGLVLCRLEKNLKTSEQQQVTPLKKYSVRKLTKERNLQQKVTLNKEQNQLANLIYRFFATNQEDRNLIVQTTQVADCSFSHLYPVSFLATTDEKIVVAVNTLEEGQQLLAEIADFNQLSAQKIVATAIKEDHHFLNLAAFSATFRLTEESRSYAKYQASLLVWLLDHPTGDLDYYPQRNDDHPFFKAITKPYRADLKNSTFAEADFLLRHDQEVANSSVLVIDQQLLVKYLVLGKKSLPDQTKLIITDAEMLPKNIKIATMKSMALSPIIKEINHFNEELIGIKKYNPLRKDILQVSASLTNILKKWRKVYENNNILRAEINFDLIKNDFTAIKKIRADLTFNQDLSGEDQLSFVRIMAEIDRFLEIISRHGSWWAKNLYLPPGQTYPMIQITDLRIGDNFQRIENCFSQLIFLSSTLVIDQRQDYLPNILSLSTYQFKIQHEVTQNRRPIYFPKELMGKNNQPQRLLYLTYFLKRLLKSHGRKQIVVVFNDFLTLEQVFSRLQRVNNFSERIIQQTVSNGNKKLIKRFLRAYKALFCTVEFFLAHDFPQNVISDLVLVDLPFPDLNDPLVHAHKRYFKEQNQDLFTDYYLPVAVIRTQKIINHFNQLLQTQIGRIMILDQRIVEAHYAQKFQEALRINKLLQILSMDKLLKNDEEADVKE